tara:strand:+ start:11779 stop:13902 length:2124 start_codon:yes stop_codon:yes gene_type:complete
MYTIRNAAPRAILRGIKDESGRPPVYEPEMIPTHLPHVFLFTERGPVLPQLVSGDKMVRTYGAKSFEYRGKYANHQTVLANTVNAEGNRLMVQRIVPPGANPPAALRLSVDVMKDEIPLYERDGEGKYVLDEEGKRIPTGDTTEGFVFRWLTGPVIEEEDDGRLIEAGDPRLDESGDQRILEDKVGLAATRTGDMTNTAGEQSTIYPIMDIEVQDFGSYGNRLGVRLSAPTVDSDIPVDAATIEEQLAYLYRISFVERDENTSTPRILETLWGEQFVDFSFKEGVVNERTNTELHIDDAVIPSYSQEAVAGMEEIRSPIGRIHVYYEHLEVLLADVHAKEVARGTIDADEDYKHLINIFSGHDYNGVPYDTVKIMGPADDGVFFNESATHYCMGGFDGVMNFQNFDDAVRFQLENYGDLDAKVLDDAMYPQSVLYDTGFTLDTKKAFFVPMGRRKDVYVVLSTQDVSQPQNRPSEESSIAIALRTAARMYPESVIYGTATCRAIVHGQSGYLLNSPYKGLLPLTIEFAQKCARYMGAGVGSWTSGRAFDMPGNNHVQMFKGVNAEWRSANVRGRDWDNGLVWVQNYDRRSLFWPGIQTVYDDDSSVLNSAANMIICVELQKVALRTWRDLTGISYLTPDQFIERSDALIKERTQGRFDGRVVVEPETFFTQNDEQRGYSWSCNIHLYAPNMKTVGTFTVVAHRITDL